jgi:hypothetical protein
MAHVEEEVGVDGGSPGEARTPPYFAYRTFTNFIGDLKQHGIPHQIDRSALKKFPGGVISQLIMGCRSLGLINGDSRPTQRLVDLVVAYETDAFAGRLGALLRDTYPYVFKMDLMTATPSMFADAIKSNAAAKGEDVLQKCRRFFIQAAQAAGIELGPRLLAGAVGPKAVGGAPRRKARTPKAAKEEAASDTGNAQSISGSSGGDGLMSKLLDKFPPFDPTWPDEIKAKWFAGFEQFMKGANPQ